MTATQDIRRLPDGSIDIAHYARKGRALHGAAVRRSVVRLPGVLSWLFAMPASVIQQNGRSARAPVNVAAE